MNAEDFAYSNVWVHPDVNFLMPLGCQDDELFEEELFQLMRTIGDFSILSAKVQFTPVFCRRSRGVND